ncbi:hypothetical protein JNB88_28985 [Rhizobium cauense]|uniref:hypothetical protein n=1 Tax=Rhizobium cauense TaxID=1166683 RepID=UPI001C6E50E3|nr:hypothetical protein [Rhizobium cauense]
MGLAGCATQDTSISSGEIRPLPGSLTYGGKVVHSRYKPGTVVKNTFLGQFGYRVFERYVVRADGTLKLTYQMTGPDFLWD